MRKAKSFTASFLPQCRHHWVMQGGSRRVAAFGCLTSALLIFGCAETDKAIYLTGAEIQEIIVGKTMKSVDPGGWNESYLPIASNRRVGMIRGLTQSAPPYRGKWSIEQDSMCVKYPSIPDQDGCYLFSRGKGNKILWFDESGALAFESVLVEVQGAASELIPPTFRQETVTFLHGENTLVGDLSLPTGPAPYPVILFVHGSGPTTRHWSFYKAIRDEFLRRGFATLIWSKPGVDESTGDYLEQSMNQRAAEVEAAIAHVSERPNIDRDRIGLWGVSQAGWVMPIVSAHRRVAFMIMMSCPAQNGLNQTLYLGDNLLASAGVLDDEKADALNELRAYYELIRTSESYEEFLAGQELLFAEVKERTWYPKLQRHPISSQMSWFLPVDRKMFQFINTLLVHDAPPRLEDLQSPLLAIYGNKDIQVDWQLGSSAYERIPRAAGNPDVTVKVFDGADHKLMQPDSEGYLDLAPGFLATMGEWLAERR